MKKLQNSFLLAMFLSLGIFALTSCGGNGSSNSGQNNKKGGQSQEQFSDAVHQFDSSWNDRVKTLNESIHQWDSSAQDQKGVMKERMEEKISNIKDKRDSLVDFLGKSKAQTEDSWQDFKQSAAKEYKDVVESINNLNKK